MSGRTSSELHWYHRAVQICTVLQHRLIVVIIVDEGAVYCAVSDPKPTCGVVTSLPIVEGQDVTLSCSMTYIRYADERRLNPGARFSASISWDSAAGTSSNKSTALDNNVGETLMADVVMKASGTEIPSYNCISKFQFSAGRSSSLIYAFNSVSWTCVSAPVDIWCTYYRLISIYFRPENIFNMPYFWVWPKWFSNGGVRVKDTFHSCVFVCALMYDFNN